MSNNETVYKTPYQEYLELTGSNMSYIIGYLQSALRFAKFSTQEELDEIVEISEIMWRRREVKRLDLREIEAELALQK